MRHRDSNKHFNRTGSHRQAMFRNMAISLLMHETIKTTVQKAKELRRVVEPLITLAKKDTVAKRRLAFARLRSKEAVGKLFTDLGLRYQTRPGGYLRILKSGFRAGDKATMAVVQLLDQGEKLHQGEKLSPHPALVAGMAGSGEIKPDPAINAG